MIEFTVPTLLVVLVLALPWLVLWWMTLRWALRKVSEWEQRRYERRLRGWKAKYPDYPMT